MKDFPPQSSLIEFCWFMPTKFRQKKCQLSNIFERKIAIVFLSICLNMCFGCSKELSHRAGSFEYPQHMFWLRNKNDNFHLRTLIWRPVIVASLCN